MAKRIKYQPFMITVPSGTGTPTVIPVKNTLDSQYKRCTGVSVIRLLGSDNIALGIRSQNDQIVDLVHSKFLEVTEATPVPGRILRQNIPAEGKEITISAQPLIATTATNNVFQVIFILEEE